MNLHLHYFWGLVLFQILQLTLPHTWLSSSLEDKTLFASSEYNDSLELKDKTVRSITERVHYVTLKMQLTQSKQSRRKKLKNTGLPIFPVLPASCKCFLQTLIGLDVISYRRSTCNLIWFNLQKPCRYLIVLRRLLHFVVLCGVNKLTSRKSCSFMAMCKLHSKESNKGMNVIVSPTVQLKRCTERQILFFDCVQVDFLKNDEKYKSSTLTMNCHFKSFQFYERNEDTTLKWLQPCTAKNLLYLKQGNYIF